LGHALPVAPQTHAPDAEHVSEVSALHAPQLCPAGAHANVERVWHTWLKSQQPAGHDVASHTRWISDIEQTQDAKMNFPILGDADRKVAKLYDMIHPEANDTLTVRSVFIIDGNKKIRAMITYPASTGRNFDEILRVIDSLQLTDSHKVATPANWKDGGDCVIVPSLSDEDAKEKFPKGWKALRPYLRMTPQPNK